jgi:hypothetical protein
MNILPGAGGAISVLEARIHSILVTDYKTSWPMLMHMAVSDYVVSEATGGGLQDDLAQLLRNHKLEMVYYAAAPDGNGITPSYHVYRPDGAGWEGGGVKTIEYWFDCTAAKLKANEEDKAAKAAAALSHFCADLSSPVHTVSNKKVHSAYEEWLKKIFMRRQSDPQGYGQLYAALRQQTHEKVTTNRSAIQDVEAAAINDLVQGAYDAWPELHELWTAKKASAETFADVDADLISLSADRFAAGANFTADLWYTAFERAGSALPESDQYLYKLCPDYDACIERLDDRVEELLIQALHP